MLCLTTSQLSFASTCIDWTSLLAQTQRKKMPRGKSIIVQDFVNQTKKQADSWLSFGIRNFLADSMRTAAKAKVMSSFSAQKQKADYYIGGHFQRMKANLRVFILLRKADNSIIKQWVLNIPYPEHRDFFRQLAKSSSDILQAAKIPSQEEKLAAAKKISISTKAYENYTNGRSALEHFRGDKFNLAKKWFLAAKKADFRSALGYQGLIDLYTFQGLYLKQKRKPFGNYYQKAESEWSSLNKFVKGTSVPSIFMHSSNKNKDTAEQDEAKGPKLNNRFLLGHASFLEGLQALGQGDLQTATKALSKTVELVPEDGIAWQNIAKIENRMRRHSRAGIALRNSKRIDKCL